jgi:hypothetical protein
MRLLPSASCLALLLAFAVPALADPPVVPAPKVGGYVQFREVAQEKVGLTAFLNRARLSVDGPLLSGFSYRVLLEMEASAGRNAAATPSLREAYGRWARGSFGIQGGQFKAPFTREYLIPIPQLETADLAVVIDSLAPKYEVGAMADYTPAPWGKFWLGVFNGEGQNATANRDSIVLPVARAEITPIQPLSVGASYARDSADSLRFGLDGSAQYWGAFVRAEYLKRHVRGRAGGMDDNGWTLLGLVRATPWLQPLVRLEDYQRPARGLARRIRQQTIGVNMDLVPTRVRLLIEGVRRRTGLRQQRVDNVLAQLQVRF